MDWQYTLNELAGVIGAQSPNSDATFSAVSTDTRTINKGDVFFALKGENFDADQFVPQAFEAGATAAVCTKPDDKGPCLLVPDALKALQQFAAHHRNQYDIPVIAITGSAGKTTAKDFTAAVLSTKFNVTKTQGNLNNEIGCPQTMLTIGRKTQAAVIEIGANHIGEIETICNWVKPTESAITIIAPAHVEGFGGIDGVAQAKGEIAKALSNDGVYYINNDDPRCAAIGAKLDCETVTFGQTGDIALKNYERQDDGHVKLAIAPLGTICIPIACRAHATNVLLAAAIGHRHGITEFEAPLRDALKNAARFKIRELGPIRIIDDSYNANPVSMAAALDALAEMPSQGPRWAALGDMLELGSDADKYHREVGEHAANAGIDRIFARGEFAQAIVEGARNAGLNEAETIGTSKTIAEQIAQSAPPNTTILIKGSRGLRMEEVIIALERIYETERTAP